MDPYLIQGCIYNLLKESGNELIHDELGFKYFCFSSLFPFIPKTPFKKGQLVNLLLSSPRKEIIYAIAGLFTQQKSFRIGSYVFEILKTNIFTPSFNGGDILITATPINISIASEMYERYGIKSEKPTIHWTNKMPLNAFIESLEHNSIHKYEKFFNRNFKFSDPLFRSFKFKNFALVPYKKAKIAGSNWEFELNNENKEYQRLFEFLLDTGFGQRNSAGFGFMNIRK